MRAPLCNDCIDVCPHDKGVIASENENVREFQLLDKSRGRKVAVFGMCLDDLMGTTTQIAPQIPFILSRLCRYIETYGLHHQRLFVEGDVENVIECLKGEFIKCGDAPLEETGDVASVAKLLIVFFEELPEPLIPTSAQSDFVKDMERLSLNSDDCILQLKLNVEKLPDTAYQVLKYLSRFLVRVACHQEYNGMGSNQLAVIFGPVIFRSSSKDPSINLQLKNIVNSFVENYANIFNDENVSISESLLNSSVDTISKQIPCQSSGMPIVSLSPLSVFIPCMDGSVSDNNRNKGMIPVLLIERQTGDSQSDTKICADFFAGSTDNKSPAVTRKRKERRFSGDDSQQRSSSEERPKSKALLSLEKFELIRRCNSHEEIMDAAKSSTDISQDLSCISIPKNGALHCVDTYSSDTMELVDDKNHSPHPPNAKRREIEHLDLHLDSSSTPWSFPPPSCQPDMPQHRGSEQNPIAEEEEEASARKAPMDCDSGKDERPSVGIPRSASCPVPGSEHDETSDAESSSLSLSWSMLFEDSEPVRADNPWSYSQHGEDEALLSPSVHKLRNSFYEAPLSPSAYRSYLSHRSSHLDPSVPPSPPVEQEDFAKKLVESSGISDSMKQLTKKIHNIKRRIKKFDEKFEADCGYKPSHAEKSNHPEAKKLLSDLYKSRKELKGLKEEAHLEQVISSTRHWRPSHSGHILGDTTNQVPHDVSKDKTKPTVEESVGATLKTLAEDRKNANRPEDMDVMTNEQVKDEKLAIQKALLHFESVHGRPCSKQERNSIRPLYDRYRNVKRLLVRSGTFSGSGSKGKELCSDLQPILEHETMDFPLRDNWTEKDVPVEEEECKPPENVEEPPVEEVEQDEKKSHSSFLSAKYDNSNFHELPLSEMIFQMQKVRSEKRHLRKILKEFETEFLKLNGRKVQKEDKAPVETIYNEYKHVKARLKLLEALVSKHDQHQLM